MQKDQIFLILIASALLFGYGYGLDMPQALQNPLKQSPYFFDNIKFNLLYFFTFLPTCFLQIPIGVLIDKYPLRKTLYTFTILGFLSQLIAGLAFQFMFPGYQWIVFITRSVFGVCGQALFTLQAIILTSFAKQNFQVSMGICLGLPFIMDAVNSITTTHIYDATKYMALTWYIGAFVSFISLISAFKIDQKFITKLQIQDKQQQNDQALLNDSTKSQQIKKLINQHEQFNFRKLKSLNSQFWVLAVTIFFFETCLGPFFDNLNDLIVKRFNIPYTDAGKILLIPFGILVVFCYIFSKVCSKTPKLRRKIIVAVSVLFFISISSVYLLPNTQNPTIIHYFFICIFLLMISLMFATEYCALITSITYFVQKQNLGTAYGVCGTFLGLSQCLFPLANSAIMDQYENQQKSYEELSLFGACLGIFPIIFSIWLLRPEFKVLDYNLSDQYQKNPPSQETVQSSLDLKN